jgi:N-acetylglucosaminyl-diphospho-decaprenol L-rhamnosyltransferase
MADYDLSIILVSWNTCDLLRQCLTSIFQSAGGLKLQLLIVDNASTDDSVEMVHREFPQVRVIRNAHNVGFAPANNQALPECSAELVLLLNPDTVLLDQALADLIQFLRHHPNVGAVGPKLVHPRVGLRVLGCGNQPTLWTIFTHYSFLSSLIPSFKAFEGIHLFVGIHDRRIREVEWISGACLLARKAALIDVRGLCENWFMYAEDWDLCARLRNKGWKIIHLPSAVVEHHLSASTEQNEMASMMPITAGRSYFIQLNNPSPIQLFAFDAIRSIGFVLRAVGYFLRGIISKDAIRGMWLKRSRLFGNFAIAALPWRSDQRTASSLSKT